MLNLLKLIKGENITNMARLFWLLHIIQVFLKMKKSVQNLFKVQALNKSTQYNLLITDIFYSRHLSIRDTFLRNEINDGQHLMT